MNILNQILNAKKEEVACARRLEPLAVLQSKIQEMTPPRNFHGILKQDSRFHFICEIKKASPSQGTIQSNFHPLQQARKYYQGGASAISVLTDQRFFQGHLSHLTEVKATVPLPVLRKDFIIDPYQIYQSRAAGADIILLIARILSHSQVQEFSRLATELQMNILLEISDETDLKKIPTHKHLILGINNRNLTTFVVDLQNSLRLKPYLPREIPVISESGIRTVEDCLSLQRVGFRGVLIGEMLMRTNDVKTNLQQLRREVNRANPA